MRLYATHIAPNQAAYGQLVCDIARDMRMTRAKAPPREMPTFTQLARNRSSPNLPALVHKLVLDDDIPPSTRALLLSTLMRAAYQYDNGEIRAICYSASCSLRVLQYAAADVARLASSPLTHSRFERARALAAARARRG